MTIQKPLSLRVPPSFNSRKTAYARALNLATTLMVQSYERGSRRPSRRQAMSQPIARAGRDRASLYQEITDKIVGELESGRVPWVQPWGTAARKRPSRCQQTRRLNAAIRAST
jgi:hypothetical protein